MSDTHMAGPEYPLNTENGPVDNLSITKTQQRMYRVIRAINAVSPRPQVRLPACLPAWCAGVRRGVGLCRRRSLDRARPL
jgi:hypothetical protein